MKPETVIIRGRLIPKDTEEVRQTSPMRGQGGFVLETSHTHNKKKNKRTSKEITCENLVSLSESNNHYMLIERWR